MVDNFVIYLYSKIANFKSTVYQFKIPNSNFHQFNFSNIL